MKNPRFSSCAKIPVHRVHYRGIIGMNNGTIDYRAGGYDHLTPTITEGEAEGYALTEFKSRGVNVADTEDIQSLGLTTVVAAENIPY